MQSSSIPGVKCVAMSADGMRELAAEDTSAPVSVALVDATGDICGRARRDAAPHAYIGDDPVLWHIQIGGVIASRHWADIPMGCGCGADPAAAARAALDHMRRSARRIARVADGFPAFFSIRRGDL